MAWLALQDIEEGEDLTDLDQGQWYYCCACQRAIAPAAAAMEYAGAHQYHFTNPAGIDFEIGCFSEAPGTALVGMATLAHTWFPGYAWRVALCRGCGIHLGWHYRGGKGGFFGLILSMLCERDTP